MARSTREGCIDLLQRTQRLVQAVPDVVMQFVPDVLPAGLEPSSCFSESLLSVFSRPGS